MDLTGKPFIAIIGFKIQSTLVQMLTLPYLGVCKLATQISGCLCVALSRTQTESHCV